MVSLMLRMQIIAGHSPCQSTDFSRITPTTDFTLIFLSKVVSNCFYTTLVKKWVEGLGFHAWELDLIPAHPQHANIHRFCFCTRNKPNIPSSWNSLGRMGGEGGEQTNKTKTHNKKLDICWAITSQDEHRFWLQQWNLFHLAMSSSLSYLSTFLLG